MPKFSKGTTKKPFLICVSGKPGVGKSTLASFAPNCCFVDTENGTPYLNVERISDIHNYEELKTTLKAFLFKPELQHVSTVIVDSLDASELFINDETAKQNGKKNITLIGYNKGYELALNFWFELFSIINELRDAGKNVILICHEQIKKIESPIYGSYDTISIRLNTKVISYVHAMVDGLFYLANEMLVSAETQKPKLRKNKIIYTTERPDILAKNRFNLPSEIIVNSEDDYVKFFEMLQQ